MTSPRIGILVVAYNAAGTLADVLDRIPDSFRPRIEEILVCDDHSQDATYLVGLGYQQLSDLPITMIRHQQNLGYGGNQKAGYRMAIEHGLDIVVLLHGDGQYAPEVIESIVEPLVRGEADAVFGSRMMEKGGARAGGMPLYKYVGNRILTSFQNAVLGTSLSEFHSGYRAYSVAALAAVDFESNSDGFNFDTQIILQMIESGRRIVEVPIPTYYGDEICYVNGLRYAKDVTADVVKYRLSTLGAGDDDEYQLKSSADSSHGRILAWMRDFPSSRVLDVGCSSGRLAAELRQQGHHVTGVDAVSSPEVETRVDRFVAADLSNGVPPEVGRDFDVVVAADVLEHLPNPERLLADLRDMAGPSTAVLVSVPNFGHWYARLRVGLGIFDYERRGILDGGHLRFFTRRSVRRLFAKSGWDVSRVDYVGLPFDVVPGRLGASGVLRLVDRVLVRLRPTLFAYQLLYQLHPATTIDEIVVPRERALVAAE